MHCAIQHSVVNLRYLGLAIQVVELSALSFLIQVTPEEDYDCLNETAGRVGREGARMEVLPGTWITLGKGTFNFPSYVSVQVSTAALF